MDFFDLIDKRRSVRKFSNESIPEGVITKALQAALLAANSSNLQPWEFYWVTDRTNKDDLVKACFSQNAAKTAQELIVAVSRIDTWKRNRNLILKNYKEKGIPCHPVSRLEWTGGDSHAKEFRLPSSCRCRGKIFDPVKMQ